MLKDNAKMGGLFYAFIVIVIAAALIQSMGDTIWDTTNVYTNGNETKSITAYRQANGNMTEGTTLTLVDNYVVDVTGYFRNGSIDVSLAENTDYTIDKTDGIVTLKDTGKFAGMDDGNNTEWVYTHGDNYVNNSTGRTLLNLIITFFAIGLVVWFVFYIKRNYLEDIWS